MVPCDVSMIAVAHTAVAAEQSAMVALRDIGVHAAGTFLKAGMVLRSGAPQLRAASRSGRIRAG